MPRRFATRLGLVLISTALLATVAVVGARFSSSSAQGQGAAALIAQHLEATPGTDAADLEGPAAAADAAFTERAYPADSVSVAQMNGARSAFAATSGRPFPKGKGRKGTWVTVGPSHALYPLTPFRNSFNYVPNAYVAGGRTTSIAISQTCKPGDCMAYITPAGGGTPVALGTVPTKLKLKPGASKVLKLKFVAPTDLAAGSYTLGGTVDPSNQIAESDDTNNGITGGGTVTVA